ncbi:amino acid-binding protein [Halomarina oriensis]|uniref:Amino acid-binding protein n=1 Tax=Halomarina oriensis TaxID=671145 RepID=A0A6B0GL44_9EURY|nr:amino acid-binding protein [Halomarina oriensis]MWG35582.1 amino acid-binding protein [Halomarina oriensis]
MSEEPGSALDGPVSDTDRAYTVRLELVDQPGELLNALRPIAENGGNLLSVFHERGHLTPRGHIPVEVDLEATPERFERIVDALRENGVNVVRAGADRYGEQLTVVLVGHLVDTDLSDTLSQLERATSATVADFSLRLAREEGDSVTSARVRLDAEAGTGREVLDALREVAAEKELTVVEPLVEVSP